LSKRPQNIPNGSKIDQTDINCTNIFHCKTFKHLPKLRIIPSGNPDGNTTRPSKGRSRIRIFLGRTFCKPFQRAHTPPPFV
jgi:hypothetical protein